MRRYNPNNYAYMVKFEQLYFGPVPIMMFPMRLSGINPLDTPPDSESVLSSPIRRSVGAAGLIPYFSSLSGETLNLGSISV